MPTKKDADFKLKGFRDLSKAIRQNPKKVKKWGNETIVRAMADAKRMLRRDPWSLGASTGKRKGVPKDSGNLRDTHRTKIKSLKGVLFPTADYAEYVHDGTRRMDARPWLDVIKRDIQPKLKEHEEDLLNKIVNNLAT